MCFSHYRQEGAGKRKLHCPEKHIDYSKVNILWRIAGLYQADYLTNADWGIPRFKTPFLEPSL